MALPPIDKPERAQRFARAIASDISLYNEDAVKDGIINDTFFDTLGPELKEGRDLYANRLTPELAATSNFFERAIVDVIIGSKGHIPSKLW